MLESGQGYAYSSNFLCTILQMETAISVCDLVGWYLLQLPPQLEHELQRNSDDFKATAMRNMEEFGRYFNLQCLCRTRRRADGILAQTCLVRLKIKLASAAAPRKMIDQFHVCLSLSAKFLRARVCAR